MIHTGALGNHTQLEGTSFGSLDLGEGLDVGAGGEEGPQDAVKFQHSFWAADPASSPTVWPVHTYQLHRCNDGMAHIASL